MMELLLGLSEDPSTCGGSGNLTSAGADEAATASPETGGEGRRCLNVCNVCLNKAV